MCLACTGVTRLAALIELLPILLPAPASQAEATSAAGSVTLVWECLALHGRNCAFGAVTSCSRTAALLVLLQVSLQGWLHCRRGPAHLAASNSFSSRGR